MAAKTVPLSAAALRLGLDYHQYRRLLLRGDLAGGRDEFGRLYVDARSLQRRVSSTKERKTDHAGARHA